MSGSCPAADLYLAAILEQAPRVLGMIDREPTGPTAGCCDRTYWCWKFVDFPGARFQEAACVLSFLYATPLRDSPYFNNPQLLEWIGLMLRFWSRIQHRDGSFDEAYPFERSLAATAFTTFYVGEALEFLGQKLPAEILALTHQSMARAGTWLLRNDETHGFLSNHLAAAAAALIHIHRVTGETAFERRSRYFLGNILRRQSREGWYEEYGGADPGYQTHGSFYLTRYWQLTQDQELEESLTRSMGFLAHFVHPDGSLGGEYASRNTQTYYPAAFEMLAASLPAAAWIAEAMRPSLTNGSSASLRGVDVYNYFPFLNNFVFAYLACANSSRDGAKVQEPASTPGLVWFPEAGIARIRRAGYDAYVGTSKGGVIKVYDRSLRRLAYSDCGYIGRLRSGRLFSSQHHDRDRAVKVSADRIELEGHFCEMSSLTLGPVRFVAFRLFTLSLGRWASLGRWLKRMLVNVLIYRKRVLQIRFRRVIEFGETSVRVCDEISGPDAERVDSLHWGPLFTTIHMGSARYFIQNELSDAYSRWAGKKLEVDRHRIVTGVKLERTVMFGQGKA